MSYRDVSLEGGAELNQLLTRLGAKLDDLSPAFDGMGEYLKRSHIDRWERSEEPDGSEWADLKPETWAKKKNPRKLREDNIMLGVRNTTYNADTNQLVFGMTDEKAPWHHFGTQNKEGETIVPQRILLGLSDADIVELNADLVDYLDIV